MDTFILRIPLSNSYLGKILPGQKFDWLMTHHHEVHNNNAVCMHVCTYVCAYITHYIYIYKNNCGNIETTAFENGILKLV